MIKPRIKVQARSRPLLTVVPMPTPEPDVEVLRVLEQFGELAQSGDMDAIAVVGVRRGGSVVSAYVLGGQTFTLMGATHQLLRRVSSEVPTS